MTIFLNQYLSSNKECDSAATTSIMKKILSIIFTIFILATPVESFAGCNSGVYDGNFEMALTGVKNDVSQCPLAYDGSGSLSAMFSSTMCIVLTIVSNSMFKVYCALMEEWKPVVAMLIFLYVLFYGMAIALGLEGGKLTGDNGAIAKIIKAVIIVVLATNADIFYSWMYEMFIGFIEGFHSALISISSDVDANGIAITNPDGSAAIDPATGAARISASPPTTLFDNVDKIFEVSVGGKFIITFAGLAFSFIFDTGGPGVLIGFLVFIGLGSMLWAFVRVFFSYVSAIMYVTFLLMLAPIYLSFGLFSKTEIAFKEWVGSLVSYVLQACIVLAFIFLISQVTSITQLFEVFTKEANYQQEGKYQAYVFDRTDITMNAPKMENVDPDGNACIPTFPYDSDQCRVANWFKLFYMVGAFMFAFILINVLTSRFMKDVPVLARYLSNFYDVKSALIIAGSSEHIDKLAGRATENTNAEITGEHEHGLASKIHTVEDSLVATAKIPFYLLGAVGKGADTVINRSVSRTNLGSYERFKQIASDGKREGFRKAWVNWRDEKNKFK